MMMKRGYGIRKEDQVEGRRALRRSKVRIWLGVMQECVTDSNRGCFCNPHYETLARMGGSTAQLVDGPLQRKS
jgi:hypothetical protein